MIFNQSHAVASFLARVHMSCVCRAVRAMTIYVILSRKGFHTETQYAIWSVRRYASARVLVELERISLTLVLAIPSSDNTKVRDILPISTRTHADT